MQIIFDMQNIFDLNMLCAIKSRSRVKLKRAQIDIYRLNESISIAGAISCIAIIRRVLHDRQSSCSPVNGSQL